MIRTIQLRTFLFLTALCRACTANDAGDEWIPLFNGHDLAGWIPKIRGSIEEIRAYWDELLGS
jgi:hypothetical protein